MSTTIWWEEVCGNATLYDSFWSSAISTNTSIPDVTSCFQKTMLTCFPCMCYVISAIGYICHLATMPKINNNATLSRFNILKLCLSIGLLLLTSMDFVLLLRNVTISQLAPTSPIDYLTTIISMTAMVFLVFITTYEYRKGVNSSGVQFLFLFFFIICQTIIVRSHIIHSIGLLPEIGDPPVESYIVLVLFYTILAARFICELIPDNTVFERQKHESEKIPLLKGESETKPKSDKILPLIRAPFWTRQTFTWLVGIIIRGYRKPFRFNDLFDLRKEEKCETVVPQFLEAYYDTTRTCKSRKAKERGLYYGLFKGVGMLVAFSSFLRVISIPVTFINPQLLRLLIAYVGANDPYTWKGIAISFGMLLANFTYTIIINNFLYYGMLAGMRARSMVNAAVYRKALRLSSSARRQTTVGQIVSLMSVDAQKIQDFFNFVSLLWSVPVSIIICIYFLWQEVGVSAFAGLAVLLLVIPVNAIFIARISMKLQNRQMLEKDQRIKLLNEMIAGIKVLKMYAWEIPFKKSVEKFREKELGSLRTANHINAFSSMCWLLTPYWVSLFIFAAYVLSSPNNVLDPDKAFVTLSLINLLAWPMSLLPVGVSNAVQGIVSLNRICRFLKLQELDDSTMEYLDKFDGNAVQIEEGTFSWEEGGPVVLNSINLTVKRGHLVAVIGAVGCGKSSLIQTLLGEMYKRQGSVKIGGTFAYVPQQAWIQFATIRNNILLGRILQPSRYSEIVQACALAPDLAMLPGGDETEIGEKGINLSGGQKQRVSLARAVYQNEDIYLLDDPLSAVDSHVGKHIFNKVIGPRGYLKDKTRILVTHGVSYLPQVDEIIVIKDGTISERGSYENLLDSNGAFAEFIRTYLADEDGLSNDDDEDGQSNDEDEEIRKLRKTFSDSEGTSTSSSTTRARRRKFSKTNSYQQENSVNYLKKMPGTKLISDETVEEGNVKASVFKAYIKAGGYVAFLLAVICHVGLMVSQVLTSIWLSDWSVYEPENGTYDSTTRDYYLGVYGGFGGIQAIFALCEAFVIAEGCYNASRRLHSALLDRFLHAPMSFFDTTPLGRIMNRITKDIDVLDTNMPLYIRQWLFALAPVLTTLIIVFYSFPMFGFVLIPIIIVFIVVQRMYITTTRDWKRIDSVKRSPVYVHFDETVVGATSIRAYRRQHDFVEKCDELIDDSQKAWFLIIHAYRLCGVLMECLGAAIVFFACLSSVLLRSESTVGLTGLTIAYSLQITSFMNAMIRCATELETYIISVERIEDYMKIDQEADWEVEEKKPPAGWPGEGGIVFQDYSTRYRPGLDLVLRNISCEIKPAEKIGIVGRTGAGKSSLSLALFRLIESSKGSISIDGQTIGELGLHNLRSNISIIPQDPVVFSGSVRDNLDPFQCYTDQQIWTALEHAHLKEFVGGLSEDLHYECGESGEALSVGQRQLLCLARALLRNTSILILDEATAAVDLETDALIQNTIRNQFKHCTILTVAHRLNTVMDYDRIMVLDRGKIKEFDSPAVLLSNKRSIFYSLAQDAGLV